MKKYFFIGIVMSVLSACSNNVLNPETPKQVQPQPQEKKVKPPVLGTSKEWDSSFDCDPIKVKNLIGKTGLTEKQVLSMTNARTYRSAYPGEAVTEDFRPDRVTVVIDPKTKRIIDSACG
ncbi:I78 family peptidase inhibitor [Acinetobacter calcoaceticus]|uniref:I78 family peptidase inhibitor n=1 Tax=Acinetobacter calcoaceticus TaxID=471 RepID=UPI002A4E1B88|nr:I78 family peptidase inhibitor [Acinetobacter calcoaceticus]